MGVPFILLFMVHNKQQMNLIIGMLGINEAFNSYPRDIPEQFLILYKYIYISKIAKKCITLVLSQNIRVPFTIIFVFIFYGIN